MPAVDHIAVRRRISARHIRYAIRKKTNTVVVQTRLVSSIRQFDKAVLDTRGNRSERPLRRHPQTPGRGDFIHQMV